MAEKKARSFTFGDGDTYIPVVEWDNVMNKPDVTDGEDGITPHIGANGNWFIGDTDTGVPAKGEKGEQGDKGDPYILTDEDKTLIAAEVLTQLGGSPVFGVVDENNNILLNGALADGTYTLKYENEDGTYTDIGTLEVGEIPEPVEPVTVDIALTDGIRIGSDGTDRTQAGYCATPHIDLTNIPKPCTIRLTKAYWCADASSATMVRVHAAKADGAALLNNVTMESVGGSYFTVVDNSNGTGNDVTVTVTSDDVATIRFSGWWSRGGVSDSQATITAANTKATLTYTPES